MFSNKPENTQFRRMSAEDEEMFVKPSSSPVMVSFLRPWSLFMKSIVTAQLNQGILLCT